MGPGSEDDVNEVEALRAEIEESRENLGAAVGALAFKADVPNRGKDAINEKKEALMEKVDDLKAKVPGVGGASETAAADSDGPGMRDKVKSKLPSGEDLKAKLPGGGDGGGGGLGEKARSVGDAAPSKDELRSKAQAAAETAKGNPAVLAAGAAAAGLVAGLTLPQSEAEKRRLAPKARQLRADAQTRVHEKVEQAKSAVNVADQAKSLAQAAAEVVREKGQQQDGKAGDVMQKAADKADEKLDRSGA